MEPLRLALLVAAAVAYAAFAASVWLVFRRAERAGPGLLAIKVGAVVSAIAEIAALSAAPSLDTAAAAAGLSLYVASISLYAWAVAATRGRRLYLAFSDADPAALIADGPWRWVRHPFYASYLISYVAGLIATGNPALLLVVGGMGTLYVAAARDEERRFSDSPLGPVHREWSRRTGMFLPRPRSWGRSPAPPEGT